MAVKETYCQICPVVVTNNCLKMDPHTHIVLGAYSHHWWRICGCLPQVKTFLCVCASVCIHMCVCTVWLRKLCPSSMSACDVQPSMHVCLSRNHFERLEKDACSLRSSHLNSRIGHTVEDICSFLVCTKFIDGGQVKEDIFSTVFFYFQESVKAQRWEPHSIQHQPRCLLLFFLMTFGEQLLHWRPSHPDNRSLQARRCSCSLPIDL